MFPSVDIGGLVIPIEYVPPLDPIAIEITRDGSNVAEVTEEEEARIDAKDAEIKVLREQIAELTEVEVSGAEEDGTTYTDPPTSPARAAFAEPKVDSKVESVTLPEPDHQPKQPPGGDIGTGLPLSDMHSRDRRDLARTKADLREGPSIDGAQEKEFDKKVSRDEQGRPVVEDSEDD